MTTVIRAPGAADFLALLPALVGFEPHNSLVLVAFRGKRTHGAMRFDLPTSGFKRFATTVLGTFAKIPAIDGVVPVICTDAPFAPADDLLEVLVGRLEQAGFEVRDALRHAGDGWGSFFDPDVPPAGHPLSAITESAIADQVPGDVRALDLPPRVPDADDLSRRRMRHQLADLQRRMDEDDYDDHVLEILDDLVFLAERSLEWGVSELDSLGALLLFALQRPSARDAVMMTWAFGMEFGDALWAGDSCAGLEALKVHPDPDVEAAGRMMGRGERPDPERIERAISLLHTLVSRADDAERCGPLSVLAWLNWALGRGSVAGHHLDEALAIDPEYGLAVLLNTYFSNGALPEWAFAE